MLLEFILAAVVISVVASFFAALKFTFDISKNVSKFKDTKDELSKNYFEYCQAPENKNLLEGKIYSKGITVIEDKKTGEPKLIFQAKAQI